MFVITLLLILSSVMMTAAYHWQPLIMSGRQLGSISFVDRRGISSRNICGTNDCSSSSANILPKSYFDGFTAIFDELDRLGSKASATSTQHTSHASRRVPTDIKETATSYDIILDVPGANKETIKAEVEDHILTISFERKGHTITSETETLHRAERYSGTSTRSLKLPEDADEDNISATVVDGIMSITIPKRSKEEVKHIKKVPIV